MPGPSTTPSSTREHSGGTPLLYSVPLRYVSEDGTPNTPGSGHIGHIALRTSAPQSAVENQPRHFRLITLISLGIAINGLAFEGRANTIALCNSCVGWGLGGIGHWDPETRRVFMSLET